jgi:hypothetical protein
VLPCGHKCCGICSEKCPKCSTCTSGISSDIPRIQLDCGHTFSIGTLDHYLNLDKYYQEGEAGVLQGRLNQLTKLPPKPECPDCSAGIFEINRYLAISRMHQLKDTVDRMVGKFDRRWYVQCNEVKAIMTRLESSRSDFRFGIRSTPLAASANQHRIRERGNAFTKVLFDIGEFNGQKILKTCFPY